MKEIEEAELLKRGNVGKGCEMGEGVLVLQSWDLGPRRAAISLLLASLSGHHVSGS